MTDFRSSPETETTREHIIAKMRSPKSNWDSIGLSRRERELIVAALRRPELAQRSQDWKAEAARRFGPIPSGGGENARLIAAYYYAFEEGAKAALADTSTPREAGK